MKGLSKLQLLLAMLMAGAVALMLAPAVVGIARGASVDWLGWANYALLGLKLGLGGIGIAWFFASREQEDEAQL